MCVCVFVYLKLLNYNSLYFSNSFSLSLLNTSIIILDFQAQSQVAWQQHLERNRSCIVDLFQGQLCSVVSCNECGNVSRTFDPFTSLSLPLPTQNDITVLVTMLRRMPRLSTAALSLAISGEPAGSSAVADKILALQM